MRVIITCGNLIFILTVTILVHSSIISRNIRENEVADALNSSADYGVDLIRMFYQDRQYDPEQKEQYLTELMQVFCQAVSDKIGTDGEVTVMLLEADIENGIFEFSIKEEYTFSFGNRKGVCYLDKVYKLCG